jgi:precorrin-3B synthase
VSRAAPDRCPGVLALHEAADGWLARVRLPGGRLAAAQLRALADVADLGNDLVELTARANLQVRGLDEGAGEEVAARLAVAGLLPSLAHERVRNVLASPLAGRHLGALADVDGVVTRLDRELCADVALSELPGRFLFLVEDGSGVLDGYDHDLALVPGAPSDERPHDGGLELPHDAELALLVAGVDSGWRAPARDAPALAIAAARAFLARREGAWRVSELPGGPRELIDALGPVAAERQEAALTWAKAPGGLAAGRTVQRDGRVALTALVPLGRLNASQLRTLAEIGADVRVSPWRTLSLVDLPDGGVAAELIGIGLILDPDSGWAGLSTCAGLGACRSAQVDVRAAAAARATTRASGAPAEHWSACTRRCGELRGTRVTVAADGGRLLLRTPSDREERIVPDVDAALKLLREPRP